MSSIKKIKDVKQQTSQLTHQEIKNVKEFATITEEESSKLAEFIYNISIILYKQHNNG